MVQIRSKKNDIAFFVPGKGNEHNLDPLCTS